MIWTKDSAKQFLSEVSDSLPENVRTAIKCVLDELGKAENNNTNMPRVEVIDEKHQSFNGEIYTKRDKNGYYYLTKILHTEVCKYYLGIDKIPNGYLIHHASKNENGDYDKEKNNIEDLQLMSREEHTSLHGPEIGQMRTFICKNCGKKYQTRFMGKNCYCSRKCKEDWKRKEILNGKDNEKRICEWCGSEFKVWKHSKKRYCSKTCAKYSQWAQMKANGYQKNVFTATTMKNAEEIRRLYSSKKFTQADLAEMFGVSTSVIGRIVRGESYVIDK